jgi:hypothetical protein
MVQLLEYEDKFIVKNDFYEATISIERGGSLTKLIYDFDTQLYREGCEYWIDGKDHYEQEYGGNGEINIITKEDDLVIIKVDSRLVSPQLKTDGGRCSVLWTFDNMGVIKSKSLLYPKYKVFGYDRYACFKLGYYTDYSLVDEYSWKKIGDIPEGQKEWFDAIYRKGISGMALRKDNTGIIVRPDKKLDNLGLYKTRAMLEIKSSDEQPRYGNFTTISFERLNEPK